LEIQPSAEPGEIKVAYRRLALKLHPDVNDSPDATARFTEVSNAYGESFLSLLVLLLRDMDCLKKRFDTDWPGSGQSQRGGGVHCTL